MRNILSSEKQEFLAWIKEKGTLDLTKKVHKLEIVEILGVAKICSSATHQEKGIACGNEKDLFPDCLFQ